MVVPLGLAVCPYSVRSPLGAVRFNAGPARDRVGPGCRSSRGRGSQPRPVDRRGLAFVNEQICELTERIAERVREMWERTVPASSTIVALISIEVDERWRTLISIGSGRSLLSLQPRGSDHHTTPKTDWLPPPCHTSRESAGRRIRVCISSATTRHPRNASSGPSRKTLSRT